MSNILLLTSDKGNSAATNTRTLLTGLGHTVTMLDTTEFKALADLSGYDLIAVVRWGGVSGMAGASAKLRASGKPAIVGMASGFGPGGQIGYGAYEIGLTSFEALTNATDTDAIGQAASHPIWDSFGETTVRPTAGTAWVATIPDPGDASGSAAPGGVKIGAVTSAAVPPNRRGSLWVFEAGTLYAAHIGGPLLARMVYLGQLYAGAGSSYTTGFAPFVQSVINWALGGGSVVAGVISGTVKDDDGNPIPDRVVRAYLRDSGELDGEAVSGSSGAFTIEVEFAEDLHYVIALDAEGGERNALIADRVIPVAT